jgi:hypothetical protein
VANQKTLIAKHAKKSREAREEIQNGGTTRRLSTKEEPAQAGSFEKTEN